MKKFSIFCIIVFWAVATLCQAQTTANVQTQQTSAPSPTAYTIVSREANSRIWQQTTYEVSPSGQIVPQIHHYTELATGLCYQQNGQWQDSKEEIDILSDGTGAATNGQHQAYFPSDIYSGAITLITPDGMQLQSRPIGLSYSDGTNTVLIADLTHSVGELISSNQVVYPDAFVGVKADLLYTYTKAGLEQDVVIEEQPPTPETFNLNSENSSLQMLTEFFDAPQPAMTGESDQWLNFGAMQMVPGKAFLLGTNDQNSEIQVDKSWVDVSGRQILVEQVPVTALADELLQLPVLQSTTTKVNYGKPLDLVSNKRLLPHSRPIKASHQSLMVAKTEPPSKGIVLDYIAFNSFYSTNNFTFQGDTTYYISGTFQLTATGGTNTFEGGAVIKYANTGGSAIWLDVSGFTLNWQASAYRPVTFTAKDDNSVGEVIAGSTGNPTNYASALFLPNGGRTNTLQNMRILYAKTGIQATYTTLIIKDSQFIDLGSYGVESTGANTYLENVLMDNIAGQAIYINGSGNYGVAENLTVHDAGTFLTLVSANFYITNSLLIGCTNLLTTAFGGILTGAYCYTNSSDAGIFQTVGAGANYLAADCPDGIRYSGTTNIDPALLTELRNKTTWPPVVYSSTNVLAPTTFSPQAQRDNLGTIDLGYHYDPLDYVFGGCNFSNNITFATGTAVGWYETNGADFSTPYGISLDNTACVSFNGSSSLPCYFTKYSMVQENGNYAWTNAGLGGVILNGNGGTPVPQLSADFTKWTADYPNSIISGASGYGAIGFLNCEFYIAGLDSYVSSTCFSNCLFFRNSTDFSDQYTNVNLTLQNCTFYNGGLGMARASAFPVSNWQIEATSFDGTDFYTNDYWDGNSTYTTFDYNAYNTNNIGWKYYTYIGAPTNGFLEMQGPDDVEVTNFNWQIGWFGNFYLLTNSLVLQKGGIGANYVGLYHFTTQTNTTFFCPEGNNTVDIGYHYVATDANGNILDNNNDGIPDYIEDANGNGSDDSGEIAWDTTGDLGLNVIITKPRNNTIIP